MIIETDDGDVNLHHPDGCGCEAEPMIIFEDDDRRVEIDPACKDAVFERILAYYDEHVAWSGESVMQMDGPQLDAAPTLADIIDDIIKPKVAYKD